MSINVSCLARRASIALVVAATACGSGGGDGNNSVGTPTDPNPPTLSTISVTLSASTVAMGQSITATASGATQGGAPFTLTNVAWSSSQPSVATVSQSGVVTPVSPGTTQITATVGTVSGSATLTVTGQAPVAGVEISPPSVTLLVGVTQLMTAIVRDQSNNVLAGRQVTWSSSDPTIASVSPTGTVQAIAPGTASIVATVENKSAAATVIVNAPANPTANCTTESATKLGVGEIRMLTVAQMSSLCLSNGASASEYVLIPFNNSNVASSTTQIELTSTSTGPVSAALSATPGRSPALGVNSAAAIGRAMEASFRMREVNDIGPLHARGRITQKTSAHSSSQMLLGVPANPTVGSIVQLNSKLSGNTCTDAPVLHPARVIAVTQHAIVFLDTLSPPGGYTNAELIAFATAFDNVGFALDTTNFGANTDIDTNGRLGIFFTPGINTIPGPVGGVIGGLFATRDLLPADADGCTASNEGEMFYMPVPDPNRVLNGSYSSKSFVSSLVVPTLAHEFQHLINAGRRIYVNNATALEQVWLNEGLSHIAEELLYYAESGNSPGQNIDLSRVRSSQAQVDAFNNDQSQNFGRLSSYLAAPSQNSPFALNDGLEMRGAIWQMLRYAADQKGGNQRNTWFALVNSTRNGQANFNSVFGDIVTITRNWAVAQFVDDIGFSVPAQYTHPSWNYRSIFGGLSTRKLPLATSALVAGTNVQLTIVGGGAAYVRFSIPGSTAATIAATSQGQAVPPNVDFILVRTL